MRTRCARDASTLPEVLCFDRARFVVVVVVCISGGIGDGGTGRQAVEEQFLSAATAAAAAAVGRGPELDDGLVRPAATGPVFVVKRVGRVRRRRTTGRGRSSKGIGGDPAATVVVVVTVIIVVVVASTAVTGRSSAGRAVRVHPGADPDDRVPRTVAGSVVVMRARRGRTAPLPAPPPPT